VWGALAIVYVVWGSTYLAIRFTVETVPPMLHAGIRFALAGLLLGAGGAVLRRRSARRRSWRLTPAQFATAAGSGVLLLTGGNGLVSVGEQRVPSGLAALIVASVPLWIVVLRAALRDRPAPVTALGVLVGFGGVALLFLPGGSGRVDTRYCALIVLASLSWSVGSLLVARLPVPADPVLLSSVQMLAGGAALFAISVGRGELSGFHLGQVSTKSWLALAYLVVFGSLVAFTAFGWLLGEAPVSVVATYAYVNPAVAVLLGALFASERLSGAVAAGGLLILVAVALVVTAEGRARRRAWQAEHPDGADAPDLAA
jgi:drug/metabolite transporter (DMT)-like permease